MNSSMGCPSNALIPTTMNGLPFLPLELLMSARELIELIPLTLGYVRYVRASVNQYTKVISPNCKSSYFPYYLMQM